MAKDKSPAYQWYPKDVLSSKRVTLMTLAEEGAYRRALDMCWLSQTLPAEPRALARIIGKNCTVRVAEVVKQMFVEANGELRHERLDEERAKQRKWSEKSSEGGQKSAKTRKSNKQEVNNPINQNATTLQPPLQNGINQKATLQFASSFASSNNTVLTHSTGVFDLNFFENKGYEFPITSGLRAALDKFLIYRNNHPKHGPVESAEQVEAIICGFNNREVNDADAIAMLAYTIERGAKGVLYELPADKDKPKPKEEKLSNNDVYEKAKSVV